MTLKPLFALMSLSAMWLAPTAEVSSDRLIAQSGDYQVLYRMIACEPGTPLDKCHAIEQQRLSRRIQREWINAAVKIHGIALTAAEEAEVEQKTAAQESNIVIAADRFKALAVAALKIKRGEDRAHVVAELSKQGITASDLDWETRAVPTMSAAEHTASKDFVAEGRQATRDMYARPYILEHLREIVRKRAKAQHRSFEDAEEAFWSDVAHATHTRIIDPAFSLPTKKGILVNQ
jgi:hypothetical protein